MNKVLLATICLIVFSATALAYPFPFPQGPFAGKYNNFEAFFDIETTIATASSQNMLVPGADLVPGNVNIGIFTVSTIYPYFGLPSEATFSSVGGVQGYITGVFINTLAVVTDDNIASSSGQLYLYYNTTGDIVYSGVTLAQSIASAQQGTLMAVYDFVPGVTLTNTGLGPLYVLAGTAPGGSGTSQAAGYLAVQPGSGPWADLLNGNAIPNPTTLYLVNPFPAPVGADLEEQSNFSLSTLYLSGSSPWVFTSFDPFQGVAVPEPSTLLLLGAGLIGLAGFGKNRFFSRK